MTTLITNDDSYSIGMKILLESALEFDKQAYAVIPSRQRSAVAMSMTLHKPLRLHKRESNVYELSGTPADCVVFSIYSKEVPKPKFVLSGINFGDNCGLSSLIGSGTVGACWIAASEGIPAIAFSMYRNTREWQNPKNWGDLEELREKTVEIIRMLRPKLEPHVFFNVALPNDVSNSEIVFNDKLQMSRFETKIDKRKDPHGYPYYWIYGNFGKSEKGKDLYDVAVNKNIVISRIDLKKMAKQGGI